MTSDGKNFIAQSMAIRDMLVNKIMSTKRPPTTSLEKLVSLEEKMIARHRVMLDDLSARSKEVDRFEQRVDQYRKEVREYDKILQEYTSSCLESIGGIHAVLKGTLKCSVEKREVRALPPVALLRAVSRSANPSSSDTRPTHCHAYGLSLCPVISPSEAQALIALAEALTFRTIVSNISTNLSQRLPKRTNVRCVLHCTKLATWLFPRLREHLRPSFHNRGNKWKISHVNSCFRFCKYHPGQLFDAHTDDVFTSRDANERSFVTVVLYLNAGYGGGSLRFLRSRWGRSSQHRRRGGGGGGGGDNACYDNVLATIDPQIGLCVMFQHDLLHEALPPTGLAKYLVRTDIVYSRVGRW